MRAAPLQPPLCARSRASVPSLPRTNRCIDALCRKLVETSPAVSLVFYSCCFSFYPSLLVSCECPWPSLSLPWGCGPLLFLPVQFSSIAEISLHPPRSLYSCRTDGLRMGFYHRMPLLGMSLSWRRCCFDGEQGGKTAGRVGVALPAKTGLLPKGRKTMNSL